MGAWSILRGDEMETASKRSISALAQRTKVLLCLAASLCLVPSESRAEAEDGDLLTGIVARSYGSHTLKTILGRSAKSQKPSKRRSPAASAVPLAVRGTERLKSYEKMVKHYSELHGLDADLIKAVIYVESAGNPRAVSPKGAAGLMQLMPGTAAELGLEDLFDPELNIASGTRYLRSLLDRFHSVELALWAYNAGPQAVAKGRLPAETEAYVPRVLKLRHFFKEQIED